MVDADERRLPFGKLLDQPLSTDPASPVFARTRWRLDFFWSGQTVGRVYTQALDTRRGCLSTLSLARILSDVNAFGISKIQEDETEVAITTRPKCNIVSLPRKQLDGVLADHI